MLHEWTHLLLWIQAGVTWFMTGVVWYMQIVDYPLMAYAAGSDYEQFQRQREARIISVVILPCFVELVTATSLMIQPVVHGHQVPASAGWLLLLFIWAVSIFLQIPSHRLLAKSFDSAAHERLVNNAWILTVSWTARSLPVVLMLVQANVAH